MNENNDNNNEEIQTELDSTETETADKLSNLASQVAQAAYAKQPTEEPPQYEELTRMVEPEVIKMGAVKRIICLFAAPGELMANIKAVPVSSVPILLCILLSMATIPFSAGLAAITTREMNSLFLEEFGIQLPEVATVDEFGELITDPAAEIFGIISGMLGALLLTPLFIFLGALMLLVLSKILKGPATLGQMFSMYAHIYVISAIGALLVTALMVMTDQFLDLTSLAAVVMPNGAMNDPVFLILTYISIFTIWANVITFIGLKIINEFDTTKAAVATGISFTLGAIFTVISGMGTFWLLNLTMGGMLGQF
ncbi:MAG: YIP1 family protein [Firmicutes bacterium]|nr:YIP1 family protein [Bacillota bacterium]